MQSGFDISDLFDVNYYYVDNGSENDQTGCHNLVHKERCRTFTKTHRSLYLGLFTDGHDAMREAQKIHPETAEWCPECCLECIEKQSPKLHTA